MMPITRSSCLFLLGKLTRSVAIGSLIQTIESAIKHRAIMKVRALFLRIFGTLIEAPNAQHQRARGEDWNACETLFARSAACACSAAGQANQDVKITKYVTKRETICY